MEQMEIVLLVAGGLIFILSFFIRDGKDGSGGDRGVSQDEVRRLVMQEIDSMRARLDELGRESLEQAAEDAERALEKLSNEKIMAVNEYSDTVLAEIHKNHEEAMFLYDMLNNKHASLKNALGDINRAVKEAEEACASLQRFMPVSAVLEENGFAGLSEEKPETLSQPSEREGQGNVLVAEPVPEEEAVIGENPEGQENNNVRILELYRQGKSVMNIARELNLGVGEVKLVVELFKKG